MKKLIEPHCHQSMITLEDVSFHYEQQPVIEGLSFTLYQRDFVGLIGSNGAGKSTLLKMIVGLLKPNQGDIRLFGQAISQFKDWERIGYVPQKKNFNPLFPATVREVVLSGLFSRKRLFRRVSSSDMARCEEAMHALSIEDLAEKRIGLLSGGQQQRVFLARALINNPDLLILDEPMTGVDAETQDHFFHLLRHMHEHHNLTFLMVSHDVDLMKSYLGGQPKQTAGKLNFYVKHSHSLEDCRETSITHSLRDLRGRLEPEYAK
ncbi:metal ABC transporter ATP-binding protein [Paenibacillus sp. y28]